MKSQKQIIVIGAGISGLVIARELSERGYHVIILESRNRAGGRIYTDRVSFSTHVELGAEFIHGDLPYTRKLLDAANISYFLKLGKLYKSEKGKIHETSSFIEDKELVIQKINNLKTDISVLEFVSMHLKGEKEKGESLIKFAKGFDVADPSRLSIFAVKDELEQGGISQPYKIGGGYGTLVDFLVDKCIKNKVELYYNTVVTKVDLSENRVAVVTEDRTIFSCDQIIATVPLSVITSSKSSKAHIEFLPPVDNIIKAARMIGFGQVIKIVIEFTERFWDQKKYLASNKQLEDLSLLYGNEPFTVWWTNDIKGPAVLTGWCGGPTGDELYNKSDEEILEVALHSLSSDLDVPKDTIRDLIIISKVTNWSRDPFSMGGYSYHTLTTRKAKQIICEPVMNKLYFAGEGVCESESIGTVEAAIESGYNTVKKLLSKSSDQQ